MQRQRGERVLSFQISHLPSRLKHMAAVGGLESEKGQLSSRARTPCLDLLIARAASQAHLKRQRGELVLSFQMSQYSCTYNCNTTGHTVHTAGHTVHTVLHTVHTVLHTVLHTAGIQLEYSWNTVRTIFTYISHTLHTVSPLYLAIHAIQAGYTGYTGRLYRLYRLVIQAIQAVIQAIQAETSTIAMY